MPRNNKGIKLFKKYKRNMPNKLARNHPSKKN